MPKPIKPPDPEELRILRENYEERASIKEFLGNLTREEAEAEAFQEVYGEKKK